MSFAWQLLWKILSVFPNPSSVTSLVSSNRFDTWLEFWKSLDYHWQKCHHISQHVFCWGRHLPEEGPIRRFRPFACPFPVPVVSLLMSATFCFFTFGKQLMVDHFYYIVDGGYLTDIQCAIFISFLFDFKWFVTIEDSHLKIVKTSEQNVKPNLWGEWQIPTNTVSCLSLIMDAVSCL